MNMKLLLPLQTFLILIKSPLHSLAELHNGTQSKPEVAHGS